MNFRRQAPISVAGPASRVHVLAGAIGTCGPCRCRCNQGRPGHCALAPSFEWGASCSWASSWGRGLRNSPESPRAAPSRHHDDPRASAGATVRVTGAEGAPGRGDSVAVRPGAGAFASGLLVPAPARPRHLDDAIFSVSSPSLARPRARTSWRKPDPSVLGGSVRSRRHLSDSVSCLKGAHVPRILARGSSSCGIHCGRHCGIHCGRHCGTPGHRPGQGH